MKALILSAGQGSRLLPLTEGRPKCLLPLGDKTAIEWQIWALAKEGVNEICVVLGYHAEDVEKVLDKVRGPNLKIKTIFNPFYKLADNLASCWLARAEMDQDFVIVNGDTLFEPAIFHKLKSSLLAPITVTVDQKEHYDSDDMKVQADGTRLLDIGKTLPLDQVNAESIGMLLFRGKGPQLFANKLDAIMHTPDGVKWWYLRAIGLIAKEADVRICSIKGLRWGEIDFPQDYENAQKLVTCF